MALVLIAGKEKVRSLDNLDKVKNVAAFALTKRCGLEPDT